MSGRRAARILVAVWAGIALGGIATLAMRATRESPPPPPPTVLAPPGELPTGIVAFEERLAGELNGSGFLLALPNGRAIGVTTAHSLGGGSFRPMEFWSAGSDRVVAVFSELYAPPGQPRTGADMTIDYVLMIPDAPPDPAIILQPDPRGAPQPGERVLLYSGLGDGRGGQQIWAGTVDSVDAGGAWIRMDSVFDPRLMSGSPVLSQQTGQVVGMTVVMNRVPGMLRIGINPIGAIVQAAGH